MAMIVLVEDELDARDMIARSLRRLGHHVDSYRDGAEAIVAIGPEVEVVVTDLVMPNADGLDLLRSLMDRGHGCVRIVITSFADKERAVAALNLGAHYLLEKPFQVTELEGVVRKLLATRAETRSIDDIFSRQLATLPIGPRDRQLIVFVLKGLGNAEIGAQFGISEQAVKSALHALYRKLGIGSRGELFHLIFPV